MNDLYMTRHRAWSLRCLESALAHMKWQSIDGRRQCYMCACRMCDVKWQGFMGQIGSICSVCMGEHATHAEQHAALACKEADDEDPPCEAPGVVLDLVVSCYNSTACHVSSLLCG